MHIEELKGGEDLSDAEAADGRGIVASGTKRLLVGAGARALFYPTLLYNVLRNRFQVEFHWWDRIDEVSSSFELVPLCRISVTFVFRLTAFAPGAVPFSADVKLLKELGVSAVITLNEPYETLVPASLYQVHSIDHLVLPTRDYCYAPSLTDICKAVDFIHGNTLRRKATYVHCKAGRGRSTTIVVCYLVQYKQMTPDAAYHYVQSIRPRVCLASSQWQAVQEYYHLKVKRAPNSTSPCSSSHMTTLISKAPRFFAAADLFTFDDGSVVVVTKADLDGYDPGQVSSEIWADLSVVYRVRVAGQATMRGFHACGSAAIPSRFQVRRCMEKATAQLKLIKLEFRLIKREVLA
ncbi:hypothetical protein RJ639_008823 [Escallonia herrerae]|uniref:phosphatidylglycerophosphatase n=1 Tax=Escallonia herrerae TaxID=1293975 RepID=A0AA88VSV0_9ASTE|nr:hypothetical protein RJ639_008823 [Escallonia herrerae]